MSKYCMIEIAFNNKEEINETINVLLSKRLVASTHIIESNSSWNWKNERESDKEFLLQVKTKLTKQNDIYNEIKKIHSYDCFEFAVYELNSINSDYLKWIDEEVILWMKIETCDCCSTKNNTSYKITSIFSLKLLFL